MSTIAALVASIYAFRNVTSNNKVEHGGGEYGPYIGGGINVILGSISAIVAGLGVKLTAHLLVAILGKLPRKVFEQIQRSYGAFWVPQLSRGDSFCMDISELEERKFLQDSDNINDPDPIFIRIIKRDGTTMRSVGGGYVKPDAHYVLSIDADGKESLQLVGPKGVVKCKS